MVPPSVQELNDADLFAIKRTITVSRREGTPEPAKREVLYDSEGLSFEGFSDREPPEAPARGGKGDPRPSAEVKKEKERKRSRPEERPPAREKYKKKFKETPGRPPPPPPEPAKGEKEKVPRGEREKAPRKSKGGGHKEGEGVPAKPPASRKVKLQSKVAVLIREGVSSTTAAVKESGSGGGSGGGSIGVKFSRDAESRAPFLKPEEKAAAEAKAGGKAEPPKETGGVKVKKAKAPKAKAGLKKPKGTGGKAKAGGEARKKRKAKPKGSLKKSKADSCSQGAGSPPLRLPPKVEPTWSGSEKSGSSPKPPSPPPGKTTAPATTAATMAATTTAAAERELTPDSQTVDSSCKTPDVSFLPEEGPAGAGGGGGANGGPPPTTATTTTAVTVGASGADPPRTEPEADSRSEAKEEPGRPLAPPPAPVAWNLQGGVDCATSGVLALTALLFKMEEANLASRAKAQELIQATNQILSHTKAPTPLGAPQPPVSADRKSVV